MKGVSLLIVLAATGVMSLGAAEASAQNQMKKILWAAEDLKWEPAVRLPGVMAVSLRGDRSKEAYEEFIRFPARYKVPRHFHTYPQTIVVIEGVYTHNRKKYGPGSYLFIPAGEKHEGGSVSDSETIIYQAQPGKFDLNLIEPPGENK